MNDVINHRFVIRFRNPVRKAGHGFSLLEMACVLAGICVMMGAGIGWLGGVDGRAVREAADRLESELERARSMALASNGTIALAVEELEKGKPGGGTRVVLLRLSGWREDAGDVDAERISPWHALPAGVVLTGGGAGGLRNAFDQPETKVSLKSERSSPMHRCRLLVVSPRGGLRFPAGSDPLLLRIVDAKKPGNEERLRIGRIVARTWRTGR